MTDKPKRGLAAPSDGADAAKPKPADAAAVEQAGRVGSEVPPTPPQQPEKPGAARGRRLPGWLVPAAVVLLGVGGVVLAAMLVPKREEDSEAIEPPPVNVRVMDVVPMHDVPDTITLNGSVVPRDVVPISAEVSGLVQSYAYINDPPTQTGRPVWATDPNLASGPKLEEGMRVRAGQPLMYLDTDLLAAAVRQAEAQLRYARTDLATHEDLRRQGMATELVVQQLREKVDEIEAQVSEARDRLKRAAIHARAAGVLNRLVAKEGEYVQPGQQVAEIVQNDKMKILVDVPERDVQYLAVGDRHPVYDRRDPDLRLTGEVTYIDALADADTRTTRIEMLVDNTARRLHTGQILRVDLVRRTLEEVVMIPLSAVIPRGDETSAAAGDANSVAFSFDEGMSPRPAGNGQRYTVYLVEGGLARPREVGIDLRFVDGQQWVRVTEGLTGGETLIVRGHQYCGPGQRVAVQNRIPPPAELASQPACAPVTATTAPATAPSHGASPVDGVVTAEERAPAGEPAEGTR